MAAQYIFFSSGWGGQDRWPALTQCGWLRKARKP